MDEQSFFETVIAIFEIAGVATMALGFVVAIALGIRAWILTKSGKTAYKTLKDSIGMVILLGLEILVAADLVHTVTSTPSLTDAAVLAIIVLIRTVLSISLQIEIDGIAPWKRAFLTSPQLMAKLASSGTKIDA